MRWLVMTAFGFESSSASYSATGFWLVPLHPCNLPLECWLVRANLDCRPTTASCSEFPSARYTISVLYNCLKLQAVVQRFRLRKTLEHAYAYALCHSTTAADQLPDITLPCAGLHGLCLPLYNALFYADTRMPCCILLPKIYLVSQLQLGHRNGPPADLSTVLARTMCCFVCWFTLPCWANETHCLSILQQQAVHTVIFCLGLYKHLQVHNYSEAQTPSGVS